MRRRLTIFGLVLGGGCLLVALQQVDAVLARMSELGGEQGSGLGFPPDATRTQHVLESWNRYVNPPLGDPGVVTASVAAPTTLHRELAVLDLLFILVYVPLLWLWRGALARALPARASDEVQQARAGLLRWTRWGIVLLGITDVAEDLLLWFTYGAQEIPVTPVDGAVTVVKDVLVGLVVLPLLLATVNAYRARADVRAVLVGSRAVLIAVGALVALLLVLPIGAQQVDDVVRAWSPGQAAWATVTTLLATWVVVLGVLVLTGAAREQLHPRRGRDPQWTLLLGAAVLTVAGVVLDAGAGAWGLFVPAALLVAIAVASWFLTPNAARRFVRWLVALLPRRLLRILVRPVRRHPHLASWWRGIARSPRPSEASWDEEDRAPEVSPDALAATGRTVATVAGATVCLVVCWVAARASAFDLLVRIPRPGSLVVALVVGLLVAVAGAIVVGRTGRVPFVVDPPAGRRAWWPWLLGLPTAAAFLGLWLTFLIDTDRWAIGLPTAIGSVAVIMVAVAAGAGGFALTAGAVRHSRVTQYKLPLLFRVVFLRRFPVVGFVLVWVLVVGAVDRGGFHDARRLHGPEPVEAPSLQQAFDSWRAAAPTAGARPLVLVAAQGGGIRAAVWTALVMECVFGPGPVPDDRDHVCADPAGPDDVRSRPSPVFLASGASGGSVGLAAWSARRTDVGQGLHVPDVDRVLDADYVAPDLARMLSGDLLYQLLAHHAPDRAAVLERSFERSWPDTNGDGLGRGLRASYALADGDGHWQIPVLALNASEVEDGCRFVTSPVDMVVPRTPGGTVTSRSDHPDDATCGTGGFAGLPGGADALPRTNELIDYLCPGEDVRLSTAGLLSARFPYVSPTAQITSGACNTDGTDGRMPKGVVSYLTDGGIADNSGASTAAQAWEALRPEAAAAESATSCVVPLFLQVDNSVADSSGNTTTRPPNQLLAPPGAVLHRFSGQEALARSEAHLDFAALRTAGGAAVGGAQGPAWFRIAPSIQPGIAPPLGWTLSGETVRDMRLQLLSTRNADTIRDLRRLVTAPLTCAATAGSRGGAS